MPSGVYPRVRKAVLKKPREPWHLQKGRRCQTPTATVSPDRASLTWAAGFLEGEGSFTRSGGKPGKFGLGPSCERITCRQIQRWPLDKLQALFGGSITLVRPKTNPISVKPIWNWNISGARARGVIYTLFTFMSPARKQQIRNALTCAER